MNNKVKSTVKNFKSAIRPDKDLVERARNGDGVAFAELIKGCEPMIRGVIYNCLYDSLKEDLDDLCQEACVNAFKGLENFKGDSAFSTWMYRIARNAAFNYNRQQDRKVRTVSEVYNDEGTVFERPDISTPLGELCADELTESVSRAIDELPADMKEAFNLREEEGLSYNEIAERVGSPGGTVRSRIFRARDQITSDVKSQPGYEDVNLFGKLDK